MIDQGSFLPLPIAVGVGLLLMPIQGFAASSSVELDFSGSSTGLLDRMTDVSGAFTARGVDGITLKGRDGDVASLFYTEGESIGDYVFGGPNTLTTIELDFICQRPWSAVGLAFGDVNFYFYADAGKPTSHGARPEQVFFGVNDDVKYGLGRNYLSEQVTDSFYTSGSPATLTMTVKNDGTRLGVSIAVSSNGVTSYRLSESLTDAGLEPAPVGLKFYMIDGAIFKKLKIVTSDL